MKNIVKITVVIIAIVVIACVGNKTPKINELKDIQGKVVGAMTTGISDKTYGQMVTGFIGGEAKEIIYFNRANDVLTALLSGKIDAFPTYNICGDYMIKRNDQLKAIPVQGKIEGGVIMAVRNEDQALKMKLDSAITILKDNGTLKTLEDQWITNLPVAEEPSNKEMPKIEGASVVYVGVSGDVMPLDYIAADGRPAGFNVALLSEISKLININFEFVSIESQARFTALSSKKIDLVFCHFQSENTTYYDDLKANSWIGTKPYFTYRGGCFVVKK